MNGRRGRLTALLAAVGALLALTIATQAAGAATRERPCNGSVELCGKPFNQVVLPGTHNSMSAEELGWKIPNQLISIPHQLEQGVRGFLIDTFYGVPSTAESGISSVSKSEGHANGDKTYLCHAYCQFGATDLTVELTKIRDFLAANPREVILFVNEDNIHPDDFAKAVRESGLLDYVYTGSTDRWPTLRDMIATNQRAVMLAQGDVGTVPWYHLAYEGPMRETPYDFRGDGNTQQGIDNLTLPANLAESCRPYRGDDNGALFLMNHWVNGTIDNVSDIVPDPAVSRILNQKDVLVNRSRACQKRRGIMPSLIAVDHFGEGDLLGAVRELNGVVAKPFLETTKPKRVVVKAGRPAVFKLSAANFGDAAGPVRVCAKVPLRLARKPRCATAELAMGGAAVTAKVKVMTKRRARGAGQVKFTLRAGGDSVTTATNLKVKPLPKKKKKAKKKPSKKRR